MAWNKMGEFSIESKVGFCGSAVERQKIYEFGHERNFCPVRQVRTPYQVVYRLISIVNFLSIRFFVKIHKDSANVEIIRDVIIQSGSQHTLFCDSEVVFVFHSDGDRGSGVQDAFIGDGDRTHTVIDGIVNIFGQR